MTQPTTPRNQPFIAPENIPTPPTPKKGHGEFLEVHVVQHNNGVAGNVATAVIPIWNQYRYFR